MQSVETCKLLHQIFIFDGQFEPISVTKLRRVKETQAQNLLCRLQYLIYQNSEKAQCTSKMTISPLHEKEKELCSWAVG